MIAATQIAVLNIIVMRHELWSDRCGSLVKVAHERRSAADCSEYRQAAGVAAMSELLQFIIVAGFGVLRLGDIQHGRRRT
jgi:hypothetical protein